MNAGAGVPISARVRAIPGMNLLGNLLAVALTIVYFTAIEPGLDPTYAKGAVSDRLYFFFFVVATIWMTVVPLNIRVFLPLLRDFKRAFPQGKEGPDQSFTYGDLHTLAGRLMKFPVRIALSNMSAWLLAGVILFSLPKVWPDFMAWSVETSHKIFFTMAFIGVVTAIFNFFLMEWWSRGILRRLFPIDSLRTIPKSPKIKVLWKLLIVSVMIGTVPVSVVSHITIHYVNQIQAGRVPLEAVADLLSRLPIAIAFILILSVSIGTALSILLAHSVSEPLRVLLGAIEQIRSGDLNAGVRVVSNDEIGVVTEGFNLMVEERRRLDSIRDVFGKYLSEEVVAEILENPNDVSLRGELRDMTILVADLRGFTSLAESESPQAVLRLINRYFEKMTDVIIRHEGTIDEFTGDGILVFFGAPRRLKDHSFRAVTCALRMQQELVELNRDNRLLRLPELKMGIGINAGELIVGNIGSEKTQEIRRIGKSHQCRFSRGSRHPRGGDPHNRRRGPKIEQQRYTGVGERA